MLPVVGVYLSLTVIDNVTFYRVDKVFMFWIKLALRRKFYHFTSNTTISPASFVS